MIIMRTRYMEIFLNVLEIFKRARASRGKTGAADPSLLPLPYPSPSALRPPPRRRDVINLGPDGLAIT